MNVTKLENIDKNVSAKQVTTEDLQNEYNYILAEKIVKNMHEKNLITMDEFNKITALNRQTFSPFLAEIMP